MDVRRFIRVPEFLEKDNPLCAQTDPEIFFAQPLSGLDDELASVKTRRSVYMNERQAKLICKECPLINDCLAYALKYDEHGIWGGTNETERRALRRRLGIRAIYHGNDYYL